MARVLVTRPLPFPALDRLAERHDVVVAPLDAANVADVAGLLCLLTDRIDEALLQTAPRLRTISNYAVGADNIDLEAARKRGVTVGTTPGVLTDATADLAFALILAAARNLPRAAADAKAGNWRTWEPAGWLGMELRGATLAIVGFGRIGQAVAKRAEAFGMRVLPVVRGRPLPQTLEQADVVSLHAPLTPQTHHLIDAEALNTMKPTAILVNTARGGLVDTQALTEALQANAIAGAALDVTDPEPLPPDHPLYEIPTALVVPHIGSATHATRERMAELAVDNLLAGLDGRPLPHPAPGG